MQQIRGFHVVHVFDISHTDGEPVEDRDAVHPELLNGDAPDGVWNVLVAQANEAGFEVIRDRRRSETATATSSGSGSRSVPVSLPRRHSRP